MVRKSHTASPADLNVPSRSVLGELPQRVIVFLGASGTNGEIRASLAKVGYDQAAHEEGQRLLVAATAYGAAGPERQFRDEATRNAFDELAEWQTQNFSRFLVTLERLHPRFANLFESVEPLTSAVRATAVMALLQRLDDLEPRAAQDQAIAALFDTLARRGLSRAERARLAEFSRRAREARSDIPWESEDRQAELSALYHWFRDWSHTAKAVIKRKDYLISLGLAERKRARRASG